MKIFWTMKDRYRKRVLFEECDSSSTNVKGGVTKEGPSSFLRPCMEGMVEIHKQEGQWIIG